MANETDSSYQSLLKKAQSQHRLCNVHWELTYRCNLRCRHCYLAPDVAAPQSRNELTTEEALELVDQIRRLGALNLSFSGGEALLRDDFFAIAEHARRHQLLLRIFSNGRMIDEQTADRLAALHPFALELSLYSPTADYHDALTCRPGSWQAVIDAVRRLRQRGVRVVLKTPLTKGNYHHVQAFRELAESLGARWSYISVITPCDDGCREPLHFRLDIAELIAVFRQLLETRLWADRVRRPDEPFCGIGSSSLAIGPDGDVFPCVQVRRRAGNLRRQSLRQIWEESSLWREMSDLTLASLPVCRTCNLRHVCSRCHGLAELEDGDLYGPAKVYCREALARAIVLIEQGGLARLPPLPPHLAEAADELAEAGIELAESNDGGLPVKG